MSESSATRNTQNHNTCDENAYILTHIQKWHPRSNAYIAVAE